ncbi:MAG TPA: ROK family protein [Candidatus Saccharimonadales bacterium]|nr:ROK family protein [Candidatus Saccharimonadales bacterium]
MLVAVDTGGTKTLVSSFGKDGVLGGQIKFATPKDQDEYIGALRSTIQDQYKDKTVEAIVVAIPGIIKDGTVVLCGNLPWKNFDVASALRGVLDDVPVFIENDAKLAGLAETRFLENIPALSLYVTISTGIGSGIITDGHLNQALRNSEAGHALIEYSGVAREWEKFASGKAIYETYGKYAREITDKQTWDQVADRISRGFLAIIPILQPDVIIIGGSIGTYFNKFDKQLVSLLKEKLPPITPCPKFVQAKYPELAVIYGCYYYALDNIVDQKS